MNSFMCNWKFFLLKEKQLLLHSVDRLLPANRHLADRVMAEMNAGLVSLAEWDKVSVEAVLGVYRYKAPK